MFVIASTMLGTAWMFRYSVEASPGGLLKDGRSMEEIQQFLGHSDINVTRKIYARFSPSYLKDAAAALEMDDLGPMDQGAVPKKRLSPLKSLRKMVGATGIEPVTPTMSR